MLRVLGCYTCMLGSDCVPAYIVNSSTGTQFAPVCKEFDPEATTACLNSSMLTATMQSIALCHHCLVDSTPKPATPLYQNTPCVLLHRWLLTLRWQSA